MPRKRIGPLRNIEDCQVELRRVYRAGRNGEMDTQDMGRFVAALQVLVGMLRDSDIEKRLQQLEDRANGHR